MSHTRKLAALGIATAMVVLAGCSGNGDSDATGATTGGATEGGNASGTTITLRLWDEQAAAAYETALPAFEKETGITVDVEVIPWADYWTSLRNDIAADKAPDVFWTNSSNYADTPTPASSSTSTKPSPPPNATAGSNPQLSSTPATTPSGASPP